MLLVGRLAESQSVVERPSEKVSNQILTHPNRVVRAYSHLLLLALCLDVGNLLLDAVAVD